MAIDLRQWPWWVWTGIAIVVLTASAWVFLIAYRATGDRLLARTLADLDARHRGTTVADLVALSPPVDALRQERPRKLLDGIARASWGSSRYLGSWSSLNQRFLLSLPRPEAGELAAVATASEADRAAWSALAAEGPLLLSAHGWLREPIPSAQQAGFATLLHLRRAPFFAAYRLAQAYAIAAFAGDRSALTGLDRLSTALHPCGDTIDARLSGMVGDLRDEAWLVAVLAGVDPAPWLADRPDMAAATADGLDGLRMLYVGGLHHDLQRGADLPTVFATGGMLVPGRTLAGISTWRFVAGYDLAFSCMWLDRFAERLRGTPADLAGYAATRTRSWRLMLSSAVLPDLYFEARNALTCDTRARRLRIAGAVAHAFQVGGTLPADAAAVRALLPADLLAATAAAPVISYAVLGPTRFRLWSPAASPAPDLLPPSRIDQPPAKPATGPCARGVWWLELDLGRPAE